MVKGNITSTSGTRVQHIGVAVNDPESVASIYKLLGFETGHSEIIADQGVEVLELTSGETSIELLQPLDSDSPVGRFITNRGGGLHHIALLVDDIKGKLSICKAEGFRLIDETPRKGAGGRLVAFIHPSSTGGVLVELVQDV